MTRQKFSTTKAEFEGLLLPDDKSIARLTVITSHILMVLTTVEIICFLLRTYGKR